MTQKQLEKLTAEAYEVGRQHAQRTMPGVTFLPWKRGPRKSQQALMAMIKYAIAHQPKHPHKQT